MDFDSDGQLSNGFSVNYFWKYWERIPDDEVWLGENSG